jgi:hypothetical protein
VIGGFEGVRWQLLDVLEVPGSDERAVLCLHIAGTRE